jgi:3-hydroxyisobutyrate dehydrogenase
MAKIAFIGLGNMGAPMVVNLVKAGHEVRVFDLVEEAVQQVAAQGAIAVDSARNTLLGAEFLISMLQTGKQVEGLMLTGEALLTHINPTALVVDCSTIDAETAKEMAQAAADKGIEFVDAPVSGGTAGAAAATLSFMVGGSEGAFERARPILETMGQNIFHAGGNGAGQLAKACNNLLLAVLMAGTAEALNLGIRCGLDPKVLSDIMLKSSGRNWALELYNPVPGVMEGVPASKDYHPGFMVDLMCKDLGLAMEASLASQSAIPMGSLARGLFNLHQGQDNGTLDFSSIFKLYRRDA